MIITLDGCAGSGKSSLAKLLADRLQFIYLNTGKMYRCLCAYLLAKEDGLFASVQRGEPFVVDMALLKDIDCSLEIIDDEMQIFLDDNSFDAQLNAAKTVQYVSQVAASPEVRAIVRKWQMDFADLATELDKGLVAEGRDMGSVIFPHAEKKYFFWADPKVRAKRRFAQLEDLNALEGRSESDVLREILARDSDDMSRDISPLVKPLHAIEVDTSEKTQEQVLAFLLEDLRQSS